MKKTILIAAAFELMMMTYAVSGEIKVYPALPGACPSEAREIVSSRIVKKGDHFGGAGAQTFCVKGAKTFKEAAAAVGKYQRKARK